MEPKAAEKTEEPAPTEEAKENVDLSGRETVELDDQVKTEEVKV
jgi:hypothetical protein